MSKKIRLHSDVCLQDIEELREFVNMVERLLKMNFWIDKNTKEIDPKYFEIRGHLTKEIDDWMEDYYFEGD